MSEASASFAGACALFAGALQVGLGLASPGAVVAAMVVAGLLAPRLQDLGRWRPLLNLVIQKAARNQQISDLITGMIANAVPKKKLFSPFFYFGLLFK